MLLSCLSSEHTGMATSGLFGSQLVLHSRLFQLKPITELSLVRWASKKAGQFLYTIYFSNCYILHLLVWNIFPETFGRSSFTLMEKRSFKVLTKENC